MRARETTFFRAFTVLHMLIVMLFNSCRRGGPSSGASFQLIFTMTKTREDGQSPRLLCSSPPQPSSGKLMEGGCIHPRLLLEAGQAHWRVSLTNAHVIQEQPSAGWCKLIPWSPRSATVSSTLDPSVPSSREGMGWDSGRFSEAGSSNSLQKVMNNSWEADQRKQRYHKWNNILV